ncbi:MAG: FimB/Mfa2 family fimbrial subunit [Rikenellaceae bacterium]|nr:FimB/Mfa2 family fimbrial subunit [Rikenellaceae bacterium]
MKVYAYFLLLATLVCGFSSCIFEDSGDCPADYTVTFRFQYLLHSEVDPDTGGYSDKFPEQVEYIHLFVYDTRTGEWAASVEKSAAAMAGYQQIELTLPYGSYTAVAWGNCQEEDYLIQGTENLSSLQVSLTLIDSQNRVTSQELAELFHSRQTFTLSQAAATVLMPLVKNTNRVNVVLRNLPSSWQSTDVLDMRVTARNSEYDEQNHFASENSVVHLPQYILQEGEVIGRFGLLRLIPEDDYIRLTIGITDDYRQEKLEWKFELPLIPLIINSMGSLSEQFDAAEYLERYDEFTIILVLDTDADNQLILEEWDYIGQPQELG